MMRSGLKQRLLWVFVVLLFLSLILFKKYEYERVLGCDLITQGDLAGLVKGKKAMALPEDLLRYQGQPVPYHHDLNVFYISQRGGKEGWDGSISAGSYGTVYLLAHELWDSSQQAVAGQHMFEAVVIGEDVWYKTAVIFTDKIMLEFKTEEFENGNAYGEVYCYNPYDTEIGAYSFKTGEGKLKYETSYMVLQEERNYTLKILKNGKKKDLSLAGMRNDDDWELDSLNNNKAEILQFYQRWNDFCESIHEERLMVHGEMVDFYLDENYMGEYLLRVPMDDKKLQTEGIWREDTSDWSNMMYGEEIQVLYNQLGLDECFELECYVREEVHDDEQSVVFAIPRRIIKKEP